MAKGFYLKALDPHNLYNLYNDAGGLQELPGEASHGA